MTKNAVINALAVANINTDQWVFDKDLVYISVAHDGNQFYSQFSHRLFFDTTNDILKIKKYSSRLVSSRLNLKEKVTTSTFLFGKGNGGLMSTYPIIFDRFRDPEVGDYLFVIDRETLVEVAQTRAQILAITPQGKDFVIETDIDLNVTNGIMAYISQIAQEQVPPSGFVRQLETDESIILYYAPITSFTADIYLSFGHVNMLSLKRDTTNPVSY